MDAVNTYKHIPFVRIRKPVISRTDLVELQRLFDTLADKRSQCPKLGESEVSFTITDCRQLLKVLEECQSEYAGDLIDLSIHLSASCDGDLVRVIEKLRHSLDSTN